MGSIDDKIEKKRILIVDDSLAQRTVEKKMLEDLYSIDLADDGDKAIRMLKSNDYSAIISDTNMYPVSGFQLYTWVCDNKSYLKDKFLLLSSVDQPMASHEGITFMNKDFRMDDFRKKVQELAEK